MPPIAFRLSVGFLVAVLLAACGDEAPPVAESVRPIRAAVVTELASGQVRQFSGVLEASDSANLSFQIGGNVLEVRVNQGDRVEAGQVLAVLDTEPFRLDVQAAEATLQRARAEVAEKRADFNRQRELYEQGWIARARFDTAERAFRSAVSQADYAAARLNLAQRDLRNTTLAAPFDGTISLRAVDPFVDVQAGQKLFQLDAEGGIEASFGLPETLLAQVTIGMPASVALPRRAELAEATITEIGSAAGAGNTFPVKAALLEPPSMVRPGMTAEVTLVLTDEARQSGYLIPLSAVAPGEAPGEGFVFVFDPVTSTVRRTPVSSAETMAGNRIAVKGIAAGDIIATAGVNFLIDGQQVLLMDPELAAFGG